MGPSCKTGTPLPIDSKKISESTGGPSSKGTPRDPRGTPKGPPSQSIELVALINNICEGPHLRSFLIELLRFFLFLPFLGYMHFGFWAYLFNFTVNYGHLIVFLQSAFNSLQTSMRFVWVLCYHVLSI